MNIKSKKMKLSYVAISLFLGFFLTSCSLMGLGYRYGDWLLKKRILEVVKLYSPQQDRLELALDDYMAWHKKEMLPRYKNFLIEVREELRNSLDKKETFKAERVHATLLSMRTLYQESALPLALKVTPILSELKEEQVDRTQTLINRKLDVLKEDSNKSKEEKVKETELTWKDNLKDWLGDLSPEQMKIIESEVEVLHTPPRARFARGVARMKSFLKVFEDLPLSEVQREKTLSERSQKLNFFFTEWFTSNPYSEWRREASKVLAKILNISTVEQRKYALQKVEGYIETIQDIQN